jgi:hypothetical protein
MNAKHLLAALAVTVLTAGTALAGELRHVVDKVNREAGTLEIGGETIHVREDVLNGVIEGSRYTVRWTEENGRKVATQVVQDDS